MRRTSLFPVLFALALVLSCASPKPQETPPDVSGIRTVLVLPFQDMAAALGTGQQVRSSLSGKMFVTGEVGPGGPGFLTTQVFEFMEKSSGYQVLSPEGARSLRSAVAGPGGKLESEREVIPEMGRRVKADAVLAGYVYRYRDRLGNAYSVENPASVAFELCLVRSSDGRMLWSGRHDETQSALSDNLLKAPEFVKRGGKWITADALAREGLDRVLKDFPKP